MTKMLSWAVIIIWMAVIFYLSHEPATASKGLSSGISYKMVGVMESIIPAIDIDMGLFHHLLRKTAHFLVYLTLGVFVFLGFSLHSTGGYRQILMALCLCILYAISDEVHQLFVPGRSGEIRDVLIDSSGAGVGIVSVWLVKKMISRKKSPAVRRSASNYAE